MTIYYIIFFIAFFLCFFDFIPYKSLKNIIYFLFSGLLIYFVANRRVGVDNDSPMYERMFYAFSKADYDEISAGGAGFVEPGYTILNKIISIFGGDFSTLLIVMAFLTGFLNYYYFKKKSIYPFLSILIYLSFFFLYRDFTQIRYALCCTLSFWCVGYFINKEYVKSIVLFVLAVSFHNTAFILLPVLPFVNLIKNKYLYILVPIPCFILGHLINFFPLLLKLGFTNDHMNIYLKEDGGGGLAVSMIGYFLLIVYIFIDYFSKGKVLENKEMFFYFRIIGVSVALNFLFIQSAIFQRFTLLLFQFSVLLIPYLINQSLIYSRKKETFIIFYFFLAIFFTWYGIRMIDEKLIRPY